jgi:hypothetical protein
MNIVVCSLVRSIVTVSAVAVAGLAFAEDSSERIERIKSEAYRKHPGDLAGGAAEANRALELELKSVTGRTSQTEVAAFAFLGYYTKNVKAYGVVCGEQGVKFSEYPAHFAALHASLLRTAAKYADTKKVIQLQEPTAIQSAIKELARIAQSRQVSVKETCILVEENAAQVARDASFARVMPNYYAELAKN